MSPPLDAASLPRAHVAWPGARRIIRSVHPPIDLFEDLADPADWPLLIAAEQKTNPRLMESLGALDLVPPARRVSGPGASFLMAPFTHVSPERPSRFADGRYGVLYVARRFETALFETMHHHARFMRRTNEAPGWTSQFRELVLRVDAHLHDLRGLHDPGGSRDPSGGRTGLATVLDPDSYLASQALGRTLRAADSDGIAYPSVRDPGGECVGLFYPDLAHDVVQGRHLDYHWNGERVDFVREPGAGRVFAVQLPDFDA
jgi:hypothetical protein